MTRKKALVTGATGQDGSYLIELLIDKGYEVHALIRRASLLNTDRLDHLYQDPHEPDRRFIGHYGDVTDGTSLGRIVETIAPDEVYNLAAQSHVRVSFDEPEYTADSVFMGTLRLLECVRDHVRASGREVRFYQAGSSEMFGSAPPPQNEATPFHPRSPYAVAKVGAHHLCVNYREAFGLHVSNGLLFNHESPRRGETFVTRKITRAVGRIAEGLQETVYLGNLEARRDWGFAGDYVTAMWQMLQMDEPGDYVIATGESHSVRDFLEAAFGLAGLDWKKHVALDERYKRPAEVDHLEGDASLARDVLGWRPTVSFDALVAMMVEHDRELARRERTLIDAGHKVDFRGAVHG